MDNILPFIVKILSQPFSKEEFNQFMDAIWEIKEDQTAEVLFHICNQFSYLQFFNNLPSSYIQTDNEFEFIGFLCNDQRILDEFINSSFLNNFSFNLFYKFDTNIQNGIIQSFNSQIKEESDKFKIINLIINEIPKNCVISEILLSFINTHREFLLPSRAAEIFINVISNLSDETSYNEENVINIYNMFTRECDKLLIENEKSIQEIFSNKQAISKKIHLIGYTILRSDYKTVILERLFAEFGNTNADLLANLILTNCIWKSDILQYVLENFEPSQVTNKLLLFRISNKFSVSMHTLSIHRFVNKILEISIKIYFTDESLQNERLEFVIKTILDTKEEYLEYVPKELIERLKITAMKMK